MNGTPEARYADLQDKLRAAWYGIGGHMASRAWAALRILERMPEEHQGNSLRYLCENYEVWDTSEQELPAPEFRFSEEELSSTLPTSNGTVLDALLESEYQANPSEDVFYANLWGHIHNPFFATERLRAFALYWTLIDDRVPYFHFGRGMKMSEEQWMARRSHLYLEFARMRFLLRSTFEQVTEEADLLLSVLDDSDSREERVILLADLIALAEKRGIQAERALKGMAIE